MYRHFAKLHGIDLMCEWNESVNIITKLPYNFMATELTKPNYSSSVYSRARLVVVLRLRVIEILYRIFILKMYSYLYKY